MTGGFGWFQKVVGVALILGYMTGELIVQNMAYLELMPAYECREEGSRHWESCYPSEFCMDDGTFDSNLVRVDTDNARSLGNWVD